MTVLDESTPTPQSATERISSSGLSSLSPPPPTLPAPITSSSPPISNSEPAATPLSTINSEADNSIPTVPTPSSSSLLPNSVAPPATDAPSSATLNSTLFSTLFIAEYTTITVAKVYTPYPPRVLSTKTVTVCPACTGTDGNASMHEPSALAGIKTPYYAPHAPTSTDDGASAEPDVPTTATPAAPAETQPADATPTEAQILRESTSKKTTDSSATEPPADSLATSSSAAASTSDSPPSTADNKPPIGGAGPPIQSQTASASFMSSPDVSSFATATPLTNPTTSIIEVSSGKSALACCSWTLFSGVYTFGALFAIWSYL
ncbi:hypothetical protein N0V82_005502 [Gnomoniopsis sp. IMI 355080]|nr:hypothetical protein N0V82_005502 [Gnomoniopsis sp. IMI 355080]